MKLMPPVLRGKLTYHQLLASIIDKNQQINVCEVGQLVNDLVDHIYQLSKGMDKTTKTPGIFAWRSLYETVVLFRVWSQPLNLKEDLGLFIELGRRFLLYGEVLKSQGRIRQDLREQLDAYPKHHRIEYSYDWLNPVFTKHELKTMYSENHPAFKDIVERTRETDPFLKSLYSTYHNASGIIHFTPLTTDIVDRWSEEELMKDRDQVVRLFLLDYLGVVYHSTDIDKIRDYSKKVIQKIKST